MTTNTNCQKELRCPRCDNERRLHLSVRAIAVMSNRRPEQYMSYEWDDESPCECPECGFTGLVKAFRSSVIGTLVDMADVVEAYTVHGDVDLSLWVAKARLEVAIARGDKEEQEYQQDIIDKQTKGIA